MATISASKLLLPAGSTLAKGLDGTLYLINQPSNQNIVTSSSAQSATPHVVIGNTLTVATTSTSSAQAKSQSLLGNQAVSTVASASTAGISSGSANSGTLTAALIDRGPGGRQLILLPPSYQLSGVSLPSTSNATSTVTNIPVRNASTPAPTFLFPQTVASTVTSAAQSKPHTVVLSGPKGTLQASSSSSSDEVINIEPDVESSVPDLGTVSSIVPSDKASTSKSYKTVQVSMNGVVQTLLVPEVLGEEMSSADITTVAKTADLMGNPKIVLDTGQSRGHLETEVTRQTQVKSSYSTDAHSAPPHPNPNNMPLTNVKTVVNQGTNFVVVQPDFASKVLKQMSTHVSQGCQKSLISSIKKTGPSILSTSKPLLRKALNQEPKVRPIAPNPNSVAGGDSIKIASVFSLNTSQEKPSSNSSVMVISDAASKHSKLDAGTVPEGKINQRAKRRATTNSPICRNCPGCKIDPKKRSQMKKIRHQDKGDKVITIPLTPIRTGGKKTITLKRVGKLNPNLFKQDETTWIDSKRSYAVKSTAKKAQTLPSVAHSYRSFIDASRKTDNVDPEKQAPLNFSKYYLVKSPAGTFLVPREAENCAADSAALFRVVTYNTGRAVAIRTPEGVQKMFVEAMDSSEAPPLSVNEKLWKQASKGPTEDESKLNIKPDPDDAEVRKRRRSQESTPTNVSDSESDSDTDSAPEAKRPPEPAESAGDRLRRLKEMLKQQEAQLAEMRQKAEDAKRVLAEMDEDDD